MARATSPAREEIRVPWEIGMNWNRDELNRSADRYFLFARIIEEG